jgi:3,4-dihydroxyphenylacetate 2,3-dioxygenase
MHDTLTPPNIVRFAYAENIVTDLDRAKGFWVDLLGFAVTASEPDTLYLRGYEDTYHHNLVLRVGPEPATRAIGFRVWEEADLDRAEAWFGARGCRTERRPAGLMLGIGETVRVQDPLGFPLEFFHAADRAERLLQRYEVHHGSKVARIDHINLCVRDADPAHRYYEELGFRCTETIEDESYVYAAWMQRKASVHDVALTNGPSPMIHHIGFYTPEAHNLYALCDVLGALGEHTHIERGPGRHGVSNAFYLYLRDPDGHRVELYTSDYFTGDPDFETYRWSVKDERRRSFWGASVVPTWYTEAVPVLDLDGRVMPVVDVERERAEVNVGADGFH